MTAKQSPSLSGLPARPDLDQYKKQAKELLKQLKIGNAAAVSRVHAQVAVPSLESLGLSDAQFVIAREHGFASWPKFAREIERRRLQLLVETQGPVAAFLIAASVPVGGAGHTSGNLIGADELLATHPEICNASIYVAAVLGDATEVRRWLSEDASLATAKGGPHGWDALTYLCFSHHLRLDKTKSEDLVETARLLLEAGADAKTGWWETETGEERNFWESAIYGAAGIAQHAELTRLLLEYGADPNDEETPYHVPESYDLSVLRVLLESGALQPESLTTMLLRKADWHDHDGIKLLLEHGAEPSRATRWGYTALHQAIRRDNALANIRLMLEHGGDMSLADKDGHTGFALAARRGRSDVLALLKERGIAIEVTGVDGLLAACALGDKATAHSIAREDAAALQRLKAHEGTFLAEFAGTGCREGVKLLLDLGVDVSARYAGDGYYQIAKDSTALHVAAWKAWPQTAKLLIERGCPVHALDSWGRTALQLAVKACVDSYWMNRRTPEIVKMLLEAGASKEGISLPTGYDEIDVLLGG
ncbi:ankyrin repeat domain-containing protein [Terriglobus sp. TAA 43]|uniref:ankyrin repeat domain-containing protein n=1 Tax=Terriglobus sp. TAA 43 TaxID=278961 RepID=UPI000A02449C|nr:ankyrin repeat domain-containing protein [Terriglobus sp. TAA 43]